MCSGLPWTKRPPPHPLSPESGPYVHWASVRHDEALQVTHEAAGLPPIVVIAPQQNSVELRHHQCSRLLTAELHKLCMLVQHCDVGDDLGELPDTRKVQVGANGAGAGRVHLPRPVLKHILVHPDLHLALTMKTRWRRDGPLGPPTRRMFLDALLRVGLLFRLGPVAPTSTSDRHEHRFRLLLRPLPPLLRGHPLGFVGEPLLQQGAHLLFVSVEQLRE